MAWIEEEEDRETDDLPSRALGEDPLEGLDLAELQTPEEEESPVTPAAIEAGPRRTIPQTLLEAPALPRATFYFPADFTWGVATSAHQVEGNSPDNTWQAWEQEEGRIKQGQRVGQACNWWRDAEADFDRAATMGLTGLRLSIEWARVEPRAGEFDDSALQRYGEMLQELCERRIEPMVTLHHFADPGWVAEQGGWENPETIAHFTRFVQRAVETLHPHCDLWCTINEPNVYTTEGYLDGSFPPGKCDLKAARSVMRNLLQGHAAAYRQIHALQAHARVGLAHHMRPLDPANPRSLLDRLGAAVADRTFNQALLAALTRGRWMLPLGFGLAWKLRRTLDWIGLNYYTRDLVAFERERRPVPLRFGLRTEGAERLDGGYGEFYPAGLFRCLKRLKRLGLPIYITENGIPDDDDDQRPRYLLTHLLQVWHAIQLCYPVMGYYHWTLVDNFEWADGWTLRFGLIALDPDTQVRIPRDGADLYTDVIRANAITPQIIDAYTPELRPAILPGCPPDR